MIYIMTLIAGFAIYKWFKWWIASAILSAWIAEKKYAPPEKQDSERLAKWVVQKMFTRN